MRGYDTHAIGRWYRFFLESTEDTAVLTESDLDGCSIEGSALKMPEGIHCMQIMYDITPVTGGTASSMTMGLRRWADGRQGFAIPKAGTYSSAYIYMFGKYVNEIGGINDGICPA